MHSPRTSGSRAFLATLIVALALLASGCVEAPSLFRPESFGANEIRSLAFTILGICLVILVVVEVLLVFSIIRYRSRPGRDPSETRGNTSIEVTWTVIPAIIVVVMFFLTIDTMATLQPGQSPAPVTVIGHQWWWEFDYPQQEFKTAGEIHIPVGRNSRIAVQSADVIHSFWIPQMGGKTDAIPGRTNYTSILPERAATYFGACAEFCGEQHAHMHFTLIADSPEDYSEWLKQQAAPAREPTTPLAQQGKQTFLGGSCVECHTVRGTAAAGTSGPDLTHFGSRKMLAAGLLQNNPSDLRVWLSDTQAVKPGNKMNIPPLPTQQVEELVAYLGGLQ